MTQVIDSIDQIADRYDAFFCDVWGVLHNGRAAYGEAADALARLRSSGKRVILITNVPRPRDVIPPQLARLGVRADAWDAIVTSGDATRAELAARAPGPMYKIGPEDYDRALWEGLGLARAPLERARFIAISGLDTFDDTPDQYADILRQAKARDLEMVCANPDIVVQSGDKLIWCAGAVAQDYAEIGGRVVMAGKPYPPIYEMAYRELAELQEIDRARILCIGDGVATDIAGANAQALDCLFVASGMHGESLWSKGLLDPEKVGAALKSENAHANYAVKQLR